ncbi:Carbohydrate ABC transporter permease [Rhodovastum atsumiense]|uniref:Carbohydrate ABC transporter permease n=1 Tax=Rhodovastum atsumiense TaxID=504468 RepID=A0A5M6J3C5_9PROT|nr:carbohydrate ABC transporter permease [Rhodovastum atsumiense]KAA5614108.1 carbohydrate ABC transporter permease [Rhodovastum atsumiense]CAH2598950.1 Carbohydrate ABC transporter permease [Rhodovastum atsumiense]
MSGPVMIRRRGDLGRAAIWLGLLAGGLVMVAPLWLAFATSLKQGAEVFSLSLWPEAPTLANYARILGDGRFPLWFLNSLVVSIATTLSVLFFDSLVGYTLCKYRFRGRGLVFVLILSTMMVPTEMLVIPWYVMARSFGWVDSYWGIMFPGMMTGFGTFLMRQFFATVPDDLLDAARIDGLSEFRIWWQVAMPLVRPAQAALAIFTFLGNWSAFLWPLIVSSDRSRYTLPVGLAFFSGENNTEWQLVMAGACLATVPTLLLFLFFQRQIIRGIALTGLKG